MADREDTTYPTGGTTEEQHRYLENWFNNLAPPLKPDATPDENVPAHDDVSASAEELPPEPGLEIDQLPTTVDLSPQDEPQDATPKPAACPEPTQEKKDNRAEITANWRKWRRLA